MKLSIVATLYKSAPYIDEFHRRASDSAKKLVGDDYEIILVNDGSPDNSLDLAVQLTQRDFHVVVVDLSRNFGHHKAMMAGLTKSLGDNVFLIDTDLEEEPEYLPTFARLMADNHCDVVYGVQESRKGGWFERWSGELYYWFFDRLANIKHPRNLVTMRLMTRRYVDALLRYTEHELVISCIWVITGFKQIEHPIRKHKRTGTSYSLAHKISHAVNAITSFSTAPLKIIFYTGFFIFIVSLLYSLFLIYQRLFNAQAIGGWTSLIVSIWMLSGLIILFLGIIGIYISKIFMETKDRPNTIVRNVYGR
jgi:putative glycosyltransferase